MYSVRCPWGAQIKVLLGDDATLLFCQLCEFFLRCDSHPWLVHFVSAWKPRVQFRVRDCVTANSSEEDSKALLSAAVGESSVRPQQPLLQNAKWHLLWCFSLIRGDQNRPGKCFICSLSPSFMKVCADTHLVNRSHGVEGLIVHSLLDPCLHPNTQLGPFTCCLFFLNHPVATY